MVLLRSAWLKDNLFEPESGTDDKENGIKKLEQEEGCYEVTMLFFRRGDTCENQIFKLKYISWFGNDIY